MGMSIDAKLLYGCYYSELPEEILDEVNEMLDNGELEYVSPYYDSSRSDWVVGVEVPIDGETWTSVEWTVQQAYESTPDILHLDSIELRLIVSPDVS